jgi:hypothetical protein
MKNAKLEVKKEASRPVPTSDADEKDAGKFAKASKNGSPSAGNIWAVEKGPNPLRILGVDANAASDELKRAYFNLKNASYDRYHPKAGKILERMAKMHLQNSPRPTRR